MPNPADEFNFPARRREMVEQQIQARGIADARLLAAFQRVERHLFVDPCEWDDAYADHPLGIGCKQTISQPFIVAYMTNLLELRAGHKVLEVGTGSGYQTAILAALGAQVFSIERHEALTERAADTLARLELDENVEFIVGDGSVGFAEEAPYDRIIVTAAAPVCPDELKMQLSPQGGIMVIPVGYTDPAGQAEKAGQRLLLVRREGDSFAETKGLDVVFVPLVGERGF